MNKKFALITGAAGLLGIHHAAALAEVGFNVVLIDIKRNGKTKLKLVTSSLRKQYPDSYFLSYDCDISSENQVKNIQKKLQKKKIEIEILINNADKNPKMNKKNTFTGRVEDYKILDLKNELSVGLVGTFICCKIFGSSMAQRHSGIIINIASDLGILAPNQEVYEPSENIKKVKNFKPIGYVISKHGILGITKYLATYWAHKNVRCNALVPGGVQNNQPNYLIKNQIKRIPMKRWATKTEFKKAIQFLANKENSYMTGQSLIIDGGKSIW
jgi:NAD(P)-dependent dehydrogenase (short-subunit alcohol dehydrogenase family)